MKALGYTWRVLQNIAYLGVVLWVFNGLGSRRDASAIIAVLGLIYVSMRSVAIGQAMAISHIAFVADRHLLRIRHLLQDDDAVPIAEQLPEVMDRWSRERAKLYIDSVFLAIIGLFCLLILFGSIT